jgi:hypothetical protein
MQLFSLIGNSQLLDGGAMFVRPIPGPHPSLRSGPPAASEFVPNESVAMRK